MVTHSRRYYEAIHALRVAARAVLDSLNVGGEQSRVFRDEIALLKTALKQMDDVDADVVEELT